MIDFHYVSPDRLAAEPWPVVWLLHFCMPHFADSRCERARLAVDSISGVSVRVRHVLPSAVGKADRQSAAGV